MRLFTLFERPPVAPYYPEKKDDNKDEKKNSTHGIVSVAASELAAHTGKAEDLAFYPLHRTVQDIGDGSSGNGIKVLKVGAWASAGSSLATAEKLLETIVGSSAFPEPSSRMRGKPA